MTGIFISANSGLQSPKLITRRGTQTYQIPYKTLVNTLRALDLLLDVEWKRSPAARGGDADNTTRADKPCHMYCQRHKP